MGDFFLTALGNGDFPQLMPWLVIVVISVIVFNLLADVAVRRARPEDPP